MNGLRAWFDALSVRGKLTATLTLQLAVLTIGCLAFLYAQRELSSARAWVNHSYVVIDHIESVRIKALEQQTSVRGYIITARADILEPFASAGTELDRLIDDLRRQVADNPAQAARLGSIDQLINEWRNVVAEPEIAFMRDPATRQRAVELNVSGEGKRRMDAIAQHCDAMMAEERRLLGQREADMQRLGWIMSALVLGLLIVGWFTGIATVNGLHRLLGVPLSRLAALVPQLNSRTPVAVPYQDRRDEMGKLAGALLRFRDSSLEQMRQEWINRQASKMLSVLQGCDTEVQYAEVLLSRLSESIEAGYALAYRWNESLATLEWYAAYGLPDPSVVTRRFRLGEGLVGQCMVERRMIELSPVPDGYLRIVSGLGAALPQRVLFVPITARGETVAVLEIGLLREPKPRYRKLLEQVLTTGGIGWQALARSLRTRELLAESQAQSEELRASEEALRQQQEELRAVNETLRTRSEMLEEQGRRLKASEEELRAQTEELGITNSALEEKTEALRLRQTELEAARVELERKAADLEQASRYKSEFLANMSHELRTPLNSMLILSKLLADNSDGNLDAEQVESARIMHDSGQSLLALINDILDLSKVEAGKMSLNPEEVDLSACVSALVERFRPLAVQRGLNFEATMAPDAPRVLHTDRARLMQVLSNLLSNALKFTHEGSVRIRADAIDDGVSIAVSDTGIGIAPDKLQQVFRAFEQADSSTSRRYGGTGLGLSIVHRMTQLLGGEVRLESIEGKGSTFTLRLPLSCAQRVMPTTGNAGSPVPAPPPARSPDPVAGEDATDAAAEGTALLVVEDDPIFARVLADIATRRGLRVLTAGSGSDALEIAARHRLAGVLLDIGLPDMSGWDVLQRLRSRPETAAVPVHIISGSDDQARTMELGAVGFLHKPVTREAVLDALDRVCAPGQPAKRRLLLVDPDDAARRTVAKLLAAEDPEIVEAISAEAALAQLAQGRFDGLILEPDLPDLPVVEFLRRASAQGALPPVVIHSRRELSTDETQRLREFTPSIVIQGSRSAERLLDEVTLFLHAIKRPGPPMITPTVHAPLADVAGKTVLVVDDDMRNVFALSKALRERGLNVVMAQDGLKALALLEARKDIDLVLMDIMMPGMDGYETIRRVRSRIEWQSLPIIAVTAKAMKGDREKCLEAGASDYCPKPIDLEQLMSLLRVWI